MTGLRQGVVRVGDEIEIAGVGYVVGAVTGSGVELVDTLGGVASVSVSALVNDPGLNLVSAVRAPLVAGDVLAGIPAAAVKRAKWWEIQVVEILTGRPPGCSPSTPVRPEYRSDRTLRQREMAKLAELRAAGEDLTLITLQRQRRAYQQDGLLGVLDRRCRPRNSTVGRVDERVVDALRRVIDAETDRSTGTGTRLMRRTHQMLETQHGADAPAMPSRATFYRLVRRLSEGKHTLGSARTRRSLAKQPDGPFSAVSVARPGEVMEIDSTPLDVRVVLDDGTVDRVELTGLVDIRTRTIAAAVLRPTTKAVDAALLLARALTPEPMRPGWPDALRLSRSVLPHRRLTGIDQRLADAAARPVIAPETIVVDHGKAYLSQTFRSACLSLGINLQPAHPDTPTDKAKVERTLGSVGTLFAQYVAGYVGPCVERRGKNAERHAVWSMLELQQLLDEWIVAVWQNRPHDGLRDPVTPAKALTPNEMYSAMVELTGYVPIPLSPDDYIELLPATWRTINSYGIKLNNRTYDTKALNPLRRQHSGVEHRNGRWEVHHDPYDVSRIWVRNHHGGGWITVSWTHLRTAPTPFGELAWQHARTVLAQRGHDKATEAEIASSAADLLDRAERGPSGPTTPAQQPSARDRRVTGRTKATNEPSWPRPEAPPPEPDDGICPAPTRTGVDSGDEPAAAKVIPLPIFDARKEAERWPF
ncbi:Mu transposase C-terminal domain-containing protein [Nocardia ninae]|uniref:Transposase n=1 Tax=Nocardia ninae NBRC 108245 TaxID=1210091 RepID=A0A511M735_9NOCA|nr:Mu transposase C-terminal domain-containing protein [Nocardia ninae]GEM36463.1 transposase [Nocardia ninae NBRC 108245]